MYFVQLRIASVNEQAIGVVFTHNPQVQCCPDGLSCRRAAIRALGDDWHLRPARTPQAVHGRVNRPRSAVCLSATASAPWSASAPLCRSCCRRYSPIAPPAHSAATPAHALDDHVGLPTFFCVACARRRPAGSRQRSPCSVLRRQHRERDAAAARRSERRRARRARERRCVRPAPAA